MTNNITANEVLINSYNRILEAIRTTISDLNIDIAAVEIQDSNGTTRARVKNDGTDNALVVTLNVVPLPVGASTASKQDTGNSLLSSIDGKLPALSGGKIPVVATDLDFRDLTSASDSVAIYGSDDGGTTKRIIKTNSDGAIQVDLDATNVSVTSFPDNEPFNIAQYGGAPVGANNAIHTQPGTGAVFPISDNSSSITVDASNLDIRHLTPTDVVTVTGGAGQVADVKVTLDSETVQVQSNSANLATEVTVSAINTKLVSGTDIGDVTINNAGGSEAVNIQDGGNTITVDGTVAITAESLPLPSGAATSANQTTANTSLAAIQNSLVVSSYGINDVATPTSTRTYVGRTDKDGAWLILSIDSSNGVALRYATIANNPNLTTYAAAWSAKDTTVVYDLYNVVF